MSVNTPAQIVNIAIASSLEKAKYPVSKLFILSFLAGAYIAFGGLLSIVIGGGAPTIAAQNPGISKFIFGAVFPVGLMMVVLAGAELFTGNNAIFMPAVLGGKQKWRLVLKNWVWVYFGNFVGALFIAFFIVHLTGIVSLDPWHTTLTNLAIVKTSNPFYVTFLKGIGANWLVCLALWLAMSSKQAIGKIFGIWWPIMAFVTLGFEHSVANMFFLPLAIFEGVDISWGTFIMNNLIPATLGNIVGGSFFVGGLYWYVFSDSEVGDKLKD
jgi:formate/nitrite transporter